MCVTLLHSAFNIFPRRLHMSTYMFLQLLVASATLRMHAKVCSVCKCKGYKLGLYVYRRHDHAVYCARKYTWCHTWQHVSCISYTWMWSPWTHTWILSTMILQKKYLQSQKLAFRNMGMDRWLSDESVIRFRIWSFPFLYLGYCVFWIYRRLTISLAFFEG